MGSLDQNKNLVSLRNLKLLHKRKCVDRAVNLEHRRENLADDLVISEDGREGLENRRVNLEAGLVISEDGQESLENRRENLEHHQENLEHHQESLAGRPVQGEGGGENREPCPEILLEPNLLILNATPKSSVKSVNFS